jgi:hypothetical protein
MIHVGHPCTRDVSQCKERCEKCCTISERTLFKCLWSQLVVSIAALGMSASKHVGSTELTSITRKTVVNREYIVRMLEATSFMIRHELKKRLFAHLIGAVSLSVKTVMFYCTINIDLDREGKNLRLKADQK